MKRVAVAVVVSAVLAALGTAPGTAAGTAADITLTGSDPAEGAALAAAPERITLTFSEPVDPELVVIFVTGADRVAWTVGEITAEGNTLTMPVNSSGPAGPCIARYTIASGDDPVRGTVSFTLTEPVASRPATAAAEPTALTAIAGRRAGDGGDIVPLWIWVVLGSAAAGLAVGALLVRRRTPRGLVSRHRL
ncbi:copper resistance CopC family protein [Actinophytocola sp.]|uniref:copper resistance CopC family protein n=1 Tax=Actinophytocola sp. TaxID=1872138 RepID=UPI003D6AFD9E